MSKGEILLNGQAWANNTRDEISLLETNNMDKTHEQLINGFGFIICQWVIFAVLCQAIDIFGTVSNIINIICFVKQGFKDPVNVSLLGLAVSDLGCILTLIWANICLTPTLNADSLSLDAAEVSYLTGAWPHLIFTRVSSWITALITLERCLCITVPLKIKNIITSKRAGVVTICVFIIFMLSVAPVYAVNSLGWKFFPAKNTSLIGLVYKKNREEVDKVSFVISALVSVSAFLVIIVCTTTLVVTLKSKSKWRKESTMSTHADTITSRNQKVSKMVVMISVLFIACFIPVSFIFIAMLIEPEVSMDGKHRNTGLLLGGIGFILESINSSMNIFIYYNMSGKYRNTFRQLFYIGNTK